MDLSAQLPALVVIAPLLAAPLCMLFASPRIAWGIALATSVICFVAALGLLQALQHVDVISYSMGGWAPPLGIELRIDALAAMLLILLGGTSIVMSLFALRSVEHEIPLDRQPLF